MATQYPCLDEKIRGFISRQKMFFTASATDASRVNVSPRSTDWFRVVDDHCAIYLDRTGSGNETAAHMLADGRLTFMFCAVEGPPRILRLYGTGRIARHDSDEFAALVTDHFAGDSPGAARQIVIMKIDLVQTSCGFGVPLFSYEGERDIMDNWAEKNLAEDVDAFWREKNQVSMDGLPTGLIDGGDGAP